MTAEAATYDGRSAGELAALLGLPAVEVFETVGSTLDLAHARGGAGTPAGTLVLADRQTAGRGRQGRSWVSEPGRGVWLTLVERPADAAALDVLSLRLGLAAAEALDPLAPERVGLKWPNDLYVAGRKLAGVLVEARWRDGRLDWIAVGFGINVREPRGTPSAAGLRPGVSRFEVLQRLVPALRTAAARTGPLTAGELAAFAARDVARGRRVREPVAGTVAGIDASGAVVIESSAGRRLVRSGSLEFVEEA